MVPRGFKGGYKRQQRGGLALLRCWRQVGWWVSLGAISALRRVRCDASYQPCRWRLRCACAASSIAGAPVAAAKARAAEEKDHAEHDQQERADEVEHADGDEAEVLGEPERANDDECDGEKSHDVV